MSAAESNAEAERSYPCPDCGKPLQRREGKRGSFWGCSDFPACRATLNDEAGKPASQQDERYRCPLCTRRLIRAEKDKGDYWFCSGFDKGCKVKLTDQNGVPEAAFRCRECGSLLVQRQGKHGNFWGCSQYPTCTSSYRDKDNRPDFDFFTAKRS